MTPSPSRIARLALAATLVTLVVSPLASAGKKPAKRKPKPGPVAVAPPAPETVAITVPAGTAPAEADTQRVAWRFEAVPFEELGSGHPGKGAADFDKPDGLAFTPDGKLLATDAKNRRVQVWDPKTGVRIGEFGHKVFGGEIVDIAVAPDGVVLVTDQTLHLAYAFAPPKPGAKDEDGNPLGPADYEFKTTVFGEQGFDKLGGIAIDSKGRIYCVDAHLNEVRRFTPDYKPDPAWKFEKKRAGGDTFLHGCEGIAIDEVSRNLFVASERDAAVVVFDLETGAYKNKLVGASPDPSGAPVGKHVFFGAVEGLATTRGYLLAVDESAGHIQMFDVMNAGAFNTDLLGYKAPARNRSGGYVGFFGHSARVDFEDKKNTSLQKMVKDESVIPGQANPPGYFCSPDSIAAFTNPTTNETYVAVADQCNYRIAVYRWTDVVGAVRKVSSVALRGAR